MIDKEELLNIDKCEDIDKLKEITKELIEEYKEVSFQLAFDKIDHYCTKRLIEQMANQKKRLLQCDEYYTRELVEIVDEFGFEYVEMKLRTKAEEYLEENPEEADEVEEDDDNEEED